MHNDLCLRYSSGEMEPREREEFQRHLESCPDCRAFLSIIEQGRSWAKSAEESAPSRLIEAAVSRAGGSSGDGGKASGGGPGLLAVLVVSAALGGGLYARYHKDASGSAPGGTLAHVSPSSGGGGTSAAGRPETLPRLSPPPKSNAGRRVRPGTSCAGSEAVLEDLKGALEGAREAHKEVLRVLGEVLGGASSDARALAREEGPSAEAAEGKSYDCPTCEPLNACLRAGKAHVASIRAGLEEEAAAVDRAARAVSAGQDYGQALEAVELELEIAEERFGKLFSDYGSRERCTQGVEDGEAVRDFESYMAEESALQERLAERLRGSWCARHNCETPDLSGLVSGLERAADASSALGESGEGLASDLEAAGSSAREADALLSRPEGRDSRNLIYGARSLSETIGMLEKAISTWPKVLREGCREGVETSPGVE